MRGGEISESKSPLIHGHLTHPILKMHLMLKDWVHGVVNQDQVNWLAGGADESQTPDLAQTATTPAFMRLGAFMLTLVMHPLRGGR